MLLVMASHLQVEYVLLSHLRAINCLCVNIFKSWVCGLECSSVLYECVMTRLKVGRCGPVFQVAASKLVDSCLPDVESISLILSYPLIPLEFF